MLNDRLTELFELQHDLQTETYGFNFQQMRVGDRIRYIKDMHTAIVLELSEVMNETAWKPWAHQPPHARWVNRDEYVGELVDVLHFFINMLLVLGDDPKELAIEVYDRYLRKHNINRQRQEDGYDGVSTKCSSCHRALDDPGVSCWRRGDQGFCAALNEDINYLTKSTLPAVRDTVEP